MKPVPEAPPVQMVLRAYPPAPARVGLAYQPAAARALRAGAALLVCWGVVPWSVWVPPHYPWPALLVALGAWLAHLFWTGRYRVRWFVGLCPRCGRHLRLAMGTRLTLPHTIPCLACHFEPRLERQPPEDAPAVAGLRHNLPDCTGTWHEAWMWDERFLCCDGCAARRPATPEMRRQARAENERGAILRQLGEEGRFLD